MNFLELKKRWEKEILNPLKNNRPERKEVFKNSSGIPLPTLATQSKSESEHIHQKIGFSGEYPYTRGIHPGMYRGRFWTMRQYAGYASAEESNERYRYLLDQGQSGLSVAFDLPTQIGYDADDPMARGEVGKVGVSISSIEDMETLFHKIPLDRVSTSMTINAPAAVLLAFYIAVAKKQGASPKQLRGTVQNDILKEYIARGTYIFPPKPSMRLITDLMQYCHEEIPNWNTISISGYHIREAGSTAAQEIAFTLANGIAYVEAALEAGLAIDDFGPQLSFFFNAHNNFLEEIAKFRAARRMWANIMKNRFNAKSKKSMMMRFHTQTAGSTLTAQQPENNVVRVTLQAMAAVMGGTQSLHTNSMDEALWLPTENSVRIALRTQQIIAHESGVADTVDPFGGSYLIESLTDQLEELANQYITTIDDKGGALNAIEQNYIQNEIHNAAYQTQQEMEDNSQKVVGVNIFESEENISLERHTINPAIEQHAIKRLANLRSTRDTNKVSELLTRLEKEANGSNNLMPLLITCVESKITLGEICNVLRKTWGEYQPDQWS